MSALRPPSIFAFGIACCGVALFSVMDAAMKGLALALGAYNALIWRNIIGTALSGAYYVARRPQPPAWAIVRLHIWRGTVVAAMAILFFWSVTLLPLAEAIALSFIAPIIALFLAALLLGERISRHAITASVLGFCGVAVIMAGRIGRAGMRRAR